MTIKLSQDEGLIKQEELDFFYKGNISLEKSEYVMMKFTKTILLF